MAMQSEISSREMPPRADLDLTALVTAGRGHEAMGPAARMFAARLAGALSGPVLWVQEARAWVQLCPQGLAPIFDPARLILVSPPDRLALLQVMEEALRSPAPALVVGELSRAPDLTESRRLQLAAGTGGGRGLCLIAGETAQSNAAETRWLCHSLPSGGQRFELIKNKRGKLGAWEVM
ncbi:MAG: hypothetical protein AAGI13_09160 [Pseudomonadota bacterium]